MTLIKQEKLVFLLVILYIRKYLCVFTKLFTAHLKIYNFGYPVPENTPLYFQCIFICHFLQSRIGEQLEKLDTTIQQKQTELEQIMPRYEELKKEEERCTAR